MQTLGTLYACAPLIDGLGHATQFTTYLSAHRLASCVIVSGFKAALDLDTDLLSNLILSWCAEWAKPGRGKAVLIMHIGFSLIFTPYLSNVVASAKSAHYFSSPCSTEAVGIAHISRLVACSARIVVDKQTDKQTDRQTDRHTDQVL